jgi:hypothetical protein
MMLHSRLATDQSQEASEQENLLVAILQRLEKILAEENQKLEAGSTTDHSIYISSKNQVLRELMVMQRSAQLDNFAPETLERLKAMRKLVDRNHQLLKLQVTALNDVTAFLTHAAITEQGDGTYNRQHQ